MSRSVAAILPYVPRKAINAFRSAWGPASSVQKRSYCPFETSDCLGTGGYCRPPCSMSCRVWACLLESKATSATAHLLRSESANTCPAEQTETLISI